MLDILLTDENLIILGLLFGLLMTSPLIIDIIVQATKPNTPEDDAE